ncbi:hypothetical protein [Myroides odoratus]|uniref:hypothetical protein n=1 Tax=Myroides odoratus TaxID=256 RepID=UPI0012E3B70E|nr:hypothetical protein [Myroides odoratus]
MALVIRHLTVQEALHPIYQKNALGVENHLKEIIIHIWENWLLVKRSETKLEALEHFVH